MKVKLTLIGKREWTKEPSPEGGEGAHCWFYAGFDEKSKPMEFKSNNGDYEINEVMKYDPKLAEEFDLKATYDSFKQRLKYSEIEE